MLCGKEATNSPQTESLPATEKHGVRFQSKRLYSDAEEVLGRSRCDAVLYMGLPRFESAVSVSLSVVKFTSHRKVFENEPMPNIRVFWITIS